MTQKLPRNNEHVKYEFDMLKLSYNQVENFSDYWGAKQTGLFNMFHESFCVHAYNLINWLGGPDEEIKKEYKMIEDQVLSLGPGRTEEFFEKLGPNHERTNLYGWIMGKDVMGKDEVDYLYRNTNTA